MTTSIPQQLAAFEPDKPDFPSDGSSVIQNVYPRVAWNGGFAYGPIGTPTPQYDALAARCQGAYGIHDEDNDVFIFAGDGSKLYQLVAGSITWADVSKAGGYHVVPMEQWQFAYFNKSVIAVNGGDPPQTYNLETDSAFSDLGGTPPKAKFVAVIKNAFVLLGYITDDGAGGTFPQRVHWSAAGNAANWPTAGGITASQVQSGLNDLLGPGGNVQGFAPSLLYADALVLQEFALRRMQYVGPPNTFDFLPMENGKGCSAPYSIVVNAGVAYYWSQDGVYANDGGQSIPIGANRIDRTIVQNLDAGRLKRVSGAADPYQKCIWWAWPSKAASASATNVGNPDNLLCYNYQLDKWSNSPIESEVLLRMLSLGYTLDQLFTVFGYTIDTVPAPFDSTIWLGGQPQIGMFNTDHKMAFFSGTPLPATIETSEQQASPGRRALITSVRPLIDGVGTVPSVSIGHREKLQDAVTYSQVSPMNAYGTCPLRSSGRYIRVRLTIPGTGSWLNASGAELEAVNLGKR